MSHLCKFKDSTMARIAACHLLLILFLCMSGCVSAPPQDMKNLCSIFSTKGSWYRAAKRAEKKWGVKANTLMAFIHQESRYQSHAKPPRQKLLGIIPWARPSSAFGFAQATDAAWEDYKEATGQWFVRRSNMKDALDFVGWYNHRSHKKLGISKNDTYSLYLAYHEGPTGFRKRSYQRKPKVKKVASKVARMAERYGSQYDNC